MKTRAMISWIAAGIFMAASLPAPAQDARADSAMIRGFFNEALTSYEAYHHLEWLCKNTKGRICGTPQAAAAVEYTRQILSGMELDSVWLQPVMVKRWDRGEPEVARIVSVKLGTVTVPSCALGWSTGTGDPGLSAPVVEVDSREEWQRTGPDKVRGKIVFFNQPMRQTNIGTFASYGEAGWQRTTGPAEAGGKGAVGCVIRSLGMETDDYPHTGITRYAEGTDSIPAIAISTRAADLLEKYLKSDPDLHFFFRTTCSFGPDVPSFNVIGELRGSGSPNDIITVGGHLDAWDIGEGAHDDGGGCMQSIEVLRLFKKAGLRPHHTIRAVMYMDEEVAQRGGQAYAEEAVRKQENQVAALESDRGVFRPKAVAISGNPGQMKKFLKWQPLFEPYEMELVRGGGGVDVGPLKNKYPNILFMGIIPEDQRYFRFHHAPSDTFEQVDRREMQMGAAGMAALVYLYDKYGL
jgi:carboxypeptidase Q